MIRWTPIAVLNKISVEWYLVFVDCFVKETAVSLLYATLEHVDAVVRDTLLFEGRDETWDCETLTTLYQSGSSERQDT